MHQQLVGRILDGRYRIVKSIGMGGMGEVYLAEHVELGIHRAVKFMLTDSQGAERAEARFRREAQTLARLKHETIVKVLDFGAEEDGLLFLAMEFIDGVNLEEQIVGSGTLTLGDAIIVLQQVARGLTYAHEQGVIHRDLKPANILLKKGSPAHIRIIDFGVAKILSDRTMTVLTTQHATIGTPLYMAPEQFLADEIGPTTDVYALAGLAYFMVAGQPVFRARSTTEIVLAHCRKAPTPLSRLCEDLTLPATLDDLLLRCLAKDPLERPTPLEFAEELRALDDRAGLGKNWQTLRSTQRRVWQGVQNAAEVGELIWNESSAPALADGAPSREMVIAQGLYNQLTALLLELSAKLARNQPQTASLGEMVSAIDGDQAQISDLEIDLALANAELSEETNTDAHHTAGLENHRASLKLKIAALNQSLNTRYRAVYQRLGELKSGVTDTTLLRLFHDFDELVKAFVVSSEG